jgi:hypothetical protein
MPPALAAGDKNDKDFVRNDLPRQQQTSVAATSGLKISSSSECHIERTIDNVCFDMVNGRATLEDSIQRVYF